LAGEDLAAPDRATSLVIARVLCLFSSTPFILTACITPIPPHTPTLPVEAPRTASYEDVAALAERVAYAERRVCAALRFVAALMEGHGLVAEGWEIKDCPIEPEGWFDGIRH
jgi:hypothetical protein